MDLHYKSVTEAGKLLRSDETTSVSLTEHILERIEQLNPKLNAFITVTSELALQQAHQADEELKQGHDRGPLHGIPVAVKDLFATKGIRTTCGSKLFESQVPDHDATAVTKLRDAGSVLLGKTSMYELAAGTTGLNPFFGQTENPWKSGHDPGGSSSGSATAVAAGMAFAALGTDTGCSVREPAHCCGIVGYKPTFGLVSKFGVQPLVWTKDHVGPLARNVEDAEIVFKAIAGFDPKDRYSLNTELKSDFASAPQSLKGIRIGVIRRYFFECDPEIEGTINAALSTIKDRGATIIELDVPDLEDAFKAGQTTFAEAGAVYEEQLRTNPGMFSDRVRTSLEASLNTAVTRYTKAQHFRQGFRARMEKLFSRVDVLVGPTSRLVPANLADQPEGYSNDVWKNTSIFNFTGHPSISIPCGRSTDGLPIGLMMTGALLADQKVLDIASLVEALIDLQPAHPDL